MAKIRTRFAPSPTGDIHIGSLRTALYSYALARKNSGDFILRIEDTDKKREVAGSKETVKKLLGIFGLDWDEYYVQSERLGLYQKIAEKLIADGHAFYCQCKPKNSKEGFSKELRDPCRDKSLKSGAVKLKIPDNKNIEFKDFVLGKTVSWETDSLADTILLKSDGFPTYHLAVVVDDHDMNVSHVLRGHDWLPSTPIHLLLYQYLGYEAPKIGHLSDIQDPEGGKLSKRRGSTSCEGLLRNGYLPEAILNFIMLLGWAPKDNRELYSLKEFVEVFDVKGLQKSNPVFNREKLDWFNGEYIRKVSDKNLTEKIYENDPGYMEKSLISEFVPLVKTRLQNLNQFKSMTSFVKPWDKFKRPSKDLFGKNYNNHLSKALEVLGKLDKCDLDDLNNSLLEEIKRQKYNTGDFFMDLRIAVTGARISPPINESIIILCKKFGIKDVKERIKRVLENK